MKRNLIFLFLAFLMFTGFIVAQEGEKEPAEFIPGFIFNTSNLLLDLNTYQGGVGIKLLYPDYALRVSAGGGYTGSSERLELTTGLTFEKPFYTGRVTPYWGGVLLLEFSKEGSEDDTNDWEIVQGFEGNLGGILGVEFFILDFLSVFAEYELTAGLAWSGASQSTGGTVTESGSTNFAVTTGLGNNASLGVVIYLKPAGRLPKKTDL